MTDLLTFLKEEQIDSALMGGVREFRENYPAEGSRYANRLIAPEALYYGNAVWEKAIAAILTGRNLLLAGPKATGKNVLADNLCALFARPAWNVSFHIGMDAYGLIGMDTYDGEKVVFRPGPVYLAAKEGGFAVLDEVNMAKNESLAVLHAALDHRRVIDVPGYDRIDVSPAARFIGTMNYGYAGTRDLNEALCPRFAILNMPIISENDLDRLINDSFPDIKDQIRSQFVQLFYEIERKAGSAEISERALDLRGLLDAIALMKKGVKSGDALQMCIVNKTFDEYERTLVMDMISARIPTDLGRADVFC